MKNIFQGIQDPRWHRASNSLCTPLLLHTIRRVSPLYLMVNGTSHKHSESDAMVSQCNLPLILIKFPIIQNYRVVVSCSKIRLRGAFNYLFRMTLSRCRGIKSPRGNNRPLAEIMSPRRLHRDKVTPLKQNLPNQDTKYSLLQSYYLFSTAFISTEIVSYRI